jgi:HK97 family phage portal protein
VSWLGEFIFGGGGEEKVADASALTWQALFGESMRSRTGLTVNEQTALRVSAVFGCCLVITGDVGKLPLKLIKEDTDGTKTVLYKHPLYRILYRRPNAWQTSMEWRMTMLLHALLCKFGISYISRAADGTVLELIPLMPGNVTVRQLANYDLVYDVSDKIGRIVTLNSADVHVLHGLSWDGFSALDLIKQGTEAIGLAIAAEETQARMHGNGAKPGGVLTTPNVLTDDQIKRVREQFASSYSGVANAFKTILLDNGLKFEPWSMTGVDGQHLETRKFQIEEVCRMFRVFPQMIAASSATPTYASAESFFGAHVGHTLQPWVTLWEQAMMRDLLSERDVEAGIEPKFILQALMRGSAEQRAAFYLAGINGGWLTRNEVRRLEDLNPIEGLDKILTPLNMSDGANKPKPKPGTSSGTDDPAPADGGDNGQ